MSEHDNCRCCAFITGLILVSTSSLAILAVGILIVRPYLETKTFEDTTCAVSGIRNIGEMKCECGKYCLSEILCVKIFVDYSTQTGQKIQNAALYQNVYALPVDKLSKRQRYPGAENCTFRRCREDVEANIQEVEMFLAFYGHINATFSCYYNTEDFSEAMLVITSMKQAIMGIGLPSIGFCIGVVLFIVYFCTGRRNNGVVLRINS